MFGDDNGKLIKYGTLLAIAGAVFEIIFLVTNANILFICIAGIVLVYGGLLLLAGIGQKTEKENFKKSTIPVKETKENPNLIKGLVSDFNTWLSIFEKKIRSYNILLIDLKFSVHPHVFTSINNEHFDIYRIKDVIIVKPSAFVDNLSTESINICTDKILPSTFRMLKEKQYWKIKAYHLNDLLYWEIAGEVKTINGSSPSMLSIAATEAIFGTAAAIGKATQNTTHTFDHREILMHFKINNENVCYKVHFSGLDTIRKMFPEKNGAIAVNSAKNTVTTVGKNDTKHTATNLDELVKLKSLLDSGIITKAEFDAKKKQLLGL